MPSVSPFCSQSSPHPALLCRTWAVAPQVLTGHSCVTATRAHGRLHGGKDGSDLEGNEHPAVGWGCLWRSSQGAQEAVGSGREEASPQPRQCAVCSCTLLVSSWILKFY